MSANRVQKPSSKPPPHPKTLRRDVLLETILRAPIVMKTSCSFCERRDFTCEASPGDSSRCASCIRHNQSHCDAQGVTVAQLRRIASQHDKIESELEKAEAEAELVAAKVRRLRRQKRVWYEKMSRAVARGVDSIEALEELERNEASSAASLLPPESPTAPLDLLPFGEASDANDPLLWSNADWVAMGLDPALLADPGSGGETAASAQGSSGSQGVPTS